MTSPTGSEHISRYRALGEFDNLVRAAREAKRALKELREEEAKLNAQSLADDKKIAASKQARAKAEKDSAESTKRAYAQSGSASGDAWRKGFASSLGQDPTNFTSNSGFQKSLKDLKDKTDKAGKESGDGFIKGFTNKLKDLNKSLSAIGFDKLDLDVGVEDAKQEIKALEFELSRLNHTTTEPEVRINTNQALKNLRSIQKLFKDEVAEDIVKQSQRVHKELLKLDALPSGKSFKFWAFTALADMSRVFEAADKGTSVFTRLRTAAAGGGGNNGNFMRTLISGFDDFSETSSNLLQKLGRVSGELYRMPGIIAVLISSLPALIAGMGALAGGAGALASGIGASVGVMAAAPGIIAAFGSAIFATSSAFGGMAEVLKNARQAHEEELQAKEQSRLGTEKALTATQKYNLAMRNLDPATQKVTSAIVDFSMAWAESQKRIGENFFKEVADSTGRLNQLLPIAEAYLGRSAAAVGKVADQGLKMITSGPWKRDFAIIAKNNADVIEDMGGAGLSLANVFRNVAVAAGPFTGWLTEGIKDGAKAFADWSEQARSDGSIADFLIETKESLQGLWRILKNLGSIVSSFFNSTVDEGQRYLDVLGDITEHWAKVADAQEEANSPLRRWMQDIRPLLSALGALVGDLARGIGKLASNQSNIQSMIDLLNVLRVQVLPAILDILQSLNDSGIAVTVARALGTMLEAIATFLNSGAAVALQVFVEVLAGFFSVLFNIASLPGVSHVIGGIAAALAALAAVSIVARFTGLFKLWDFFTWMTRNRGNLSGAFTDAARGAAGLNNIGAGTQTSELRKAPSTVNYTGIGAEVLNEQARATDNVARASQNAAGKTSLFARALAGVRSGASAARTGVSNMAGMIGAGGPLGIALVAATVAIGVLSSASAEYNGKIDGLKLSLGQLGTEYEKLIASGQRFGSSTDDALRGIVANNPELQRAVINLDEIGISFEQLSRAAAGGQTDMTATLQAIDAELDVLGDKWRDESNFLFTVFSEDAQKTSDRMTQLRQLREAIKKNGEASKLAADANKVMAGSTDEAAKAEGALANFIGPVSIETRKRLTREYEDNANKIQALEGYVKTFSDTESTAADKAQALRNVIKSQTGAAEDATEASENWNRKLLDLRDAVNTNGKSLNQHTRAGLNNRDALQDAARATRELYLQDIAAGKPMDDVTKKHQARIRELEKEARRLGLNKEETKKLIKTYGDVPDVLKTDVQTDSRGFQAVYADLLKLQVMQEALKSGKSPEQAQRDWVNRSSSLYRNYSPTRPGGDGYGAPGFANGGPVWGAGTRTSDSIRAWLSNGEFVQPTDAVEHYGLPVMEALRKKKLDRAAIAEALPDAANNPGGFASGGQAHSHNCPACSSGGHKFASGGHLRVPITVDPKKTLIDKDWLDYGGGIGGGSGAGGVSWMMRALRQRFPGLRLISGYRPGSRTLSGNRSYHSLGRAVDLAPRRDVAAWIRSTYGARTKELITPFQDLNLHNGRPHRYTGAIWNQHNFAGGNAHNHWAYAQGGLVDLMNKLNVNNLAPQQNAPLPSTPRTLSPAASSVVNNSTDQTRTFGDVIINNPMPERSGDSVRDALYRTQMLL